MKCVEKVSSDLKGRVRIFEAENPSNIILDEKNLILNGTSWLFSKLMYDNQSVTSSVWGLALGSGNTSWDGNLVDPVETDYKLESEITRLALTNKHYIDSNGLSVTWATTVDFQTNVSTTTIPALQGRQIRELGLIGGNATSFPTSPYFDPGAPLVDSVILINLKRFQALTLPDGVNFIISWQLAF